VSSLASFKAQYKGQGLKYLNATKVLIWNSGTEIISLNDIAQNEPLRLCLESDGEILDIKITLMSSAANMIEIGDISEKVKRINFDYVAPKEGFCLSVLHTAPKVENLLVKGIIKGGGEPQIFKKPFIGKYLENFAVMIVVLIVMGTVAMFSLTWQKWLFGILSVIVSLIIIAFFAAKLEEMTGGNLDKSFKKYFDPSDFT
jgi:hypothetical protein